jgi:hypothetical protein
MSVKSRLVDEFKRQPENVIMRLIKEMPSHYFKNEYGEKFTIYSGGTFVLMSGDETNNGIVPLFNPDFSIWNKYELYELGKALMELHKPDKGDK